MQNNEKQLSDMMKSQLKNQLSSEQEEDNVSTYCKFTHYQEQPQSRTGFRKPIKNPFSDQSDSSDSDLEQTHVQKNTNPFPPKQPKPKSVLQQAQQTMKWDRQEEIEIQILTKLQGQGMKDKKIQQLAKKYKSLNITYERQKTQRRNLQTQLNNQLKLNQQNRNKSIEKDNNSTIRSLDRSQVKQGKCTNPACAQNEKKIMQFRLQSQNLKTQLNKAHRLLTREIGENFNVDQALNQQNAWKGRQQKIQKLKGRVKELQQRLANNGVNVSHMSGFTQISSASKINNNFSTTRTSTMADNKRKQFDNLKIQVDALKSQNQLLQGKVKALNSRKINLQGELKELKGDYEKKKNIFMQKSQNDDKFISLLKNQNEKLKKEQRVVTKVVYKDQRDNDQAAILKREVEKLRAQLKKVLQKKSVQKQQKVMDRGEQEDQKIQIKFPPTQKKRTSVERPGSSKISQVHTQIRQQNQDNKGSTDRQLSADKKKQLQNQYVKGNKYLKKLTPEEEVSIYQSWKSGKKIQ